jgi:hypothetical protein
MSNGGGKIEIIKPFSEALELTKKILFQPFDFTKWLVIGFAAFLAGHFSAGGFNPLQLGNLQRRQTQQSVFASDLESWKPWLPIAIVIFAVLIFVLIILLTWLRARGNFIFTDCIVRNRGAIVDPWRQYRKEGNSYFLFSLAVVFGSLTAFGALMLIVFIPLGIFGQGRSNDAMTPIFIVFFLLLFVVWICFAILFGLISYFMVPVMYIRRCGAVDAFRDVLKLVVSNVGSFILFCLFGFCLVLAMIMIGGLATCLTCCLAALPYVGTVILLPVFVCLRAFGLLFIRQFGGDYDVWAGIPATPPTPVTQPPSLPT